MKIQFAEWSVLAAVCVAAMGCASDLQSHNLPPAKRLLGPGPGVGGPGPGVLPPHMPVSAHGGMPAGLPIVGSGVKEQHNVQFLFNRPEAMQVQYDVSGVGRFDSVPLVLPGRKDFAEDGIYRLKLTNIPGREGTELYPTLEVGPITPRTAAYLSHNAIPVQLTEEDFDQVLSGNFVTKVIYLPDPEFQEMALAGVETLVSTRLDPGVDPIVEADRRGSIMAVVRMGNKDIEMPGANGDSIIAAAYETGRNAAGGPTPMSGAMVGPTGTTPAYVSGMTVPSYGMPMTGTPIGLPGPPHIPLGAPAGFQRQVITNHTRMHIPGPTESLHMRVRQMPGYSYPKPPSRVWIREQSIHPSPPFNQPHRDRIQVVH